jgi:hypothetical protein
MFFAMPWTCGCVLVLFSTWALPFSKRGLHPTELSISAGCVCGLEVEMYFELYICLIGHMAASGSNLCPTFKSF